MKQVFLKLQVYDKDVGYWQRELSKFIDAVIAGGEEPEILEAHCYVKKDNRTTSRQETMKKIK